MVSSGSKPFLYLEMNIETGEVGQIKEKTDIRERMTYNTRSGKSQVPTCPDDNGEAIMVAFRYFLTICYNRAL